MRRKLKIFLITFSVVVLCGCAAILIIAAGRRNKPAAGGAAATPVPTAPAAVVLSPDNNIPEGGAEGTPSAALPTEELEPEPTKTPWPETAVKLGEGISATKEYYTDTAEEGEVSFVFAGDILFDRRYAVYAHYLQSGSLENCISPELLEIMRSADVCMVNNEFPYSDRGTPEAGKQYTFRAEPSSVSLLQGMGADIAGIANNHAFDYGADAFEDTLDTLEGAGIIPAGGGRNVEEASTPVYIYAADMKIAVIAASQIEQGGTIHSRPAGPDRSGLLRSWPEDNGTLDAIRRAKEECDVVMLAIHWGSENKVDQDWVQQKQLPDFLAAGADVIIGCHPHILQKLDYSGEVPIVYSLGNYWFNSKSLDSCLVELKLSGGGVKSLRFIPCRQSGCEVRLLHDAEAETLLDYMRGISPGVTIDGEGYVEKR